MAFSSPGNNIKNDPLTGFGFRRSVLRYLVNLPALFPDIERIAIYGSRAKGNFYEGSDIDVALWGGGLDFSEIVTITAYLEGLPTLYKFDVTHYDTLTQEDLKDHIDRVGKIIYERGKEST